MAGVFEVSMVMNIENDRTIDPASSGTGRIVTLAIKISMTLPALLVMFSFTSLEAEKGKNYDLKIKPKPLVGQLTEVSYSESVNIAMTVQAGKKKPLKETPKAQSARFELTVQVLEVSGEKITKQKWTFKTARFVGDGTETAYGFEGKSVIITRTSSGKISFKYEDGTGVSNEDLSGIAKVPGVGEGKMLRVAGLTPTGPFKDMDGYFGTPGGPDGGQTDLLTLEDGPSAAEVLKPIIPVKIGQSWSPDVKLAAQCILGSQNLTGIDMKKSKGKLTLKSVKVVDGKEVAVIKGKVDLYGSALDGKASVLLSVAVRAEMSMDGSVQDGKMDVTLKNKVKTGAAKPGAKSGFEILVDETITRRLTVKTVKPATPK